MNGSSPLTRGKQPFLSPLLVSSWLIPAHAGKTEGIRGYGGLDRAHPRSRGENIDLRERDARHVGSSPLTRGKPPAVLPPSRDTGLIPAHAGKTAKIRQSEACPRAHPRSRGENGEGFWEMVSASGSSPLTRGKLRAVAYLATALRLIPAHAGKTAAVDTMPDTLRAHPRSRGENDKALNSIQSGTGSSPLTRGKRIRGAFNRVYTRLIPAHAGKTPHG